MGLDKGWTFGGKVTRSLCSCRFINHMTFAGDRFTGKLRGKVTRSLIHRRVIDQTSFSGDPVNARISPQVIG